ncbi:RN135 ligase, partial [Amia calva]|nr:RN135 ligase [Amia calva]
MALDPARLDSVTGELQCPICWETFRDPVRASCGTHYFCLDCMHKFTEAKKFNCCCCMGPYNPQHRLEVDRTMRNICEKLRAGERDATPRAAPARPSETLQRSLAEVTSKIRTVEEHLAKRQKTRQELTESASWEKDTMRWQFGELKRLIEEKESAALCVLSHRESAAQQRSDHVLTHLGRRLDSLRCAKSRLEQANPGNCSALLQSVGFRSELGTPGGSGPSVCPSASRLTSCVSLEEEEEEEEEEEAGSPAQVQMVVAVSEAVAELKSNIENKLGAILNAFQVPSPATEGAQRCTVSLCVSTDRPPGPTAQTPPEEMECSTIQEPERPANLMQCLVRLSFSPERAHPFLTFSEDFRRVSVRKRSRTSPCKNNRFKTTQAMAAQVFSQGEHYWEVDTASCVAWAVGVAYCNLGLGVTVGRDSRSWCLEGNMSQLSAWHANKEVLLSRSKPGRVGVHLRMGEGELSFYCMPGAEEPLWTYQACFTEALQPVFWLYGLKDNNMLFFPEA